MHENYNDEYLHPSLTEYNQQAMSLAATGSRLPQYPMKELHEQSI
jgi:hypothetical protein